MHEQDKEMTNTVGMPAQMEVSLTMLSIGGIVLFLWLASMAIGG